jgi:F-type H+-transporting ATPase subunit c
MDSMTIIAVASIVTAGLTIAIGSVGPALGEGRSVSTALSSLVSMILIFANPFWNHVIADAAKVAGK